MVGAVVGGVYLALLFWSWTILVMQLRRSSGSDFLLTLILHAVFRPPVYLAAGGLWFLWSVFAGHVPTSVLGGLALHLAQLLWVELHPKSS